MKYSKKKLETITHSIQYYGIIETVKMICSVLIDRGAKRLILFALSQPKPVPKAFAAAKNHTFKFATEEELIAISHTMANDPENKPSREDIKLIATGQARCMLQFDGNKLAGYAWVWNSKLAYISDGYHINLPDDTIYNFKGYTPPSYRGYGFQALRHLKLLELLKNENIHRLFGYVYRTNPRSLRGVKKSGYKKVGEIRIKHKNNGSIKINLILNESFWVDKART